MKTLILFLAASSAFAAISGSTVWEVRTTGSDTSGGGYVSGGTDMSVFDNKNATGCTNCQSASANLSSVNASAAGTTTITCSDCAFTSAITGNIVYLAGGSGSIAAQWRQATYASSTTITIDATIATSTGMTINIGGALASPGQAGANYAANNTIWIKSGTYTIANTTADTSGGPLSIPNGTAVSGMPTVEGYQTSRGDMGTAPILQVASSGVTNITVVTDVTGAQQIFANLTVDGQSKTGIRGFSITRRETVAYKLTALNCTNSGIVTGAGMHLVKGVVTGSSTTAPAISLGGDCLMCEAYSNTVVGIAGTAGSAVCNYCLSYNNTGASSYGFQDNTSGSTSIALYNSVAYGNGGSGFFFSGLNASLCVNCAAENNGGWGFGGNQNINVSLLNCAADTGHSGAKDSHMLGIVLNFVTATAEMFTNAAGGDFSLNTTAGGGAALRAAGIPGAYLSTATTGYLDIGAAQHADPPSGGGTRGYPIQ